MKEDLQELEIWLRDALAIADSVLAVEVVRIEALGKKGRLTTLLKTLGRLSPAERARQGETLNAVKQTVLALIEARLAALREADMEVRLAAERVDITLPARPEPEGCIHPVSRTIDTVAALFGAMGFSIAEGPDIEDDFHNFTALNMPLDHPAPQMHDTFYLPKRADGSQFMLRTHTSPVQIRTMRAQKPPIRIIAPGRTYRCDSDMTHTPMFHQVEGLVIDESTHFGHLKGCMTQFIHAYFESDTVPVRFRPSFFPFTEPSAEVDIGCSRRGGEMKLGPGGDWLEIMGCGMVHPRVLTACGLDPERWQGFAFGMGVERLAMLKHGIPDLRTFYESDVRWLRHYGFRPFK